MEPFRCSTFHGNHLAESPCSHHCSNGLLLRSRSRRVRGRGRDRGRGREQKQRQRSALSTGLAASYGHSNVFLWPAGRPCWALLEPEASTFISAFRFGINPVPARGVYSVHDQHKSMESTDVESNARQRQHRGGGASRPVAGLDRTGLDRTGLARLARVSARDRLHKSRSVEMIDMCTRAHHVLVCQDPATIRTGGK